MVKGEKEKQDTFPALPHHRLPRQAPARNRRSRLHFVEEDQAKPASFFIKRWWKKLTDASTGSPSDGIAGTSEGSASVAQFLSNHGIPGSTETEEDWKLDEIVVEREERDSDGRRPDGTRTAATHTDGTGDHAGESNHSEELYSGSSRHHTSWAGRTWDHVVSFFNPRFDDPSAELEYQKLTWYQGKRLLFFSVVYLYLNWILYLILNHSTTIYEKVVFYGPLSILTFPLFIMIFFDVPQSAPILFQIILVSATWYCGIFEIVQTKQCHFFTGHPNQCHGKDFLALLYYVTGFPTLILFAHGGRLYHAVAQVIAAAFIGGFMIPVQGIFSRNLVSFILYSIFVQAFHWDREKTSRRMFRLNSQLKIAYKAQQKSQIQESAANMQKRRFASYLFHEVRVPLNTAMLAYQNLQSEGALKEAESTSQSLEVYALESSLTTMQQVLNDILDLQRMDAGRFEMTPRPFDLHAHFSSLLGGAKIATDAKGLRLVLDLDSQLHQIGIVVGDPVRLQQIISNIVSNAVKFTTSGDIRVTARVVPTVALTSLASPHITSRRGSKEVLPIGTSSSARQSDTTAVNSPAPTENFVTFRFEVQDSGPGIRPSDLASSRLFRPFAQTRVGRASGEGSGLGLAIVRQIVALSDGRLGIRSQKGRGATFWFELTYRLATAEEAYEYTQSLSTPSPPTQIPLPSPPPLSSSMGSSLGYTPLLTPLTPLGGLESPLIYPTTPLLSQVPLESPAISTAITPRDLLPVAVPAPTVAPSLSHPLDAEITEEPLTALVVDDDPLTRALFTRMLTRLGAVVETACDGRQCVDLILGVAPDFTARSFDLICLDNSMPVMNGEEAVRMLREEGRMDLYVVGCTGNALREDQEAYLRAGADKIIAKPVLQKDIIEILATAKARKLAAQP